MVNIFFLKRIIVSLSPAIVCLFSTKLFAQAPSSIIVTPVSTTIAKLDKFEANVSLTAGYTNPYDYDDITIRGVFTAPGGRKDTVDGFFMQDYRLNTADGFVTPAGSGTFKIRYAPNEVGTWQYGTATGNNLVITLPSVAWDLAVTAVFGGVTPVIDLSTAKQLKIYPNLVESGKLWLAYDLTTTSKVNIDLFDIMEEKQPLFFMENKQGDRN